MGESIIASAANQSAALTGRRSSPWRYSLPTALIDRHVLQGFHRPASGWSGKSFGLHGRGLIMAIARKAKLAQRKAVPHVARLAQSIFKRQLARVIQKATGIIYSQRSAPATKAQSVWLDLILPEHEAIWASAIEEVFGDDLEVVMELVPPVRSVMGQAYGQTADLMGTETNQAGEARLSREAQHIAEKITGINDTTRRKMQSMIRDSIEDGLTVTETAQRMREELPVANQPRALTIARTELSNAWGQGSIEAFKLSPTLTHVSVIGCEAREPKSPQYRGESTCNIQDVPVADAASLEFHPNHTGVLVPSRFRDE